MIQLTPANILLEVCAIIVIAVIFIFNIKREMK
jgi:hypothetical protein